MRTAWLSASEISDCWVPRCIGARMRHGHWLKKGQGVGQAPRELTPLESALHFFGAQLRYWRTLRMLSQAELGRRTHDSGALISKIEKGERFPNLALATGWISPWTPAGRWPNSGRRLTTSAPPAMPLVMHRRVRALMTWVIWVSCGQPHRKLRLR
jgi:hypothetical protein